MTDDGTPTTTQLAQSLLLLGWQVVILGFPPSVVAEKLLLPREINRITLSDLSEGHLKEQLEFITHNYGSISAFIHLHPLKTTKVTAKAILKVVFMIAKHLKKPLNEAAQHGRSWFISVAHLDGKLGLAQTNNFNPIDGGLFGLTKTLNLEWKKVFCRAIDIEPHLNVTTTVQSIIAEIFDPNRLIAEVGYSSQGRTTLVNEQYDIVQQLNASQNPINQNSVFLVSGGARGITAQCVIKLAELYRCKFILLGRSNIEPEPIYTQDCWDRNELKKCLIENIMAQGEKPTPAIVEKNINKILHSREIKQTLSKIEQLGGQAEYISADISEANILRKSITKIVSQFGRITGIIHGAGNLADKLIENKTLNDFEAVYTPKIEGLENLLNCVNVEQLNHLVLFSSVAGFYGNIGQSDYAIANEILNKFAHQFKHQYPNCQVLSFNWGPWDGGMVTTELKQIFSERHIDVIPVEVGTQILVTELHSGNPENVQILVGSSLINLSEDLDTELCKHRIYQKLTLADNPFLKDHIIGNYSVLPTMFASAWIANITEQLYPGYKFFSLSELKVLKGIVFDRNLADEYILDFQEINKSSEQGVELIANVSSQTAGGKTYYHYRGKIKLVKQIPCAPIYENFDLTQDETLANLSPYEDGTLFHGSSFQGVKHILNLTPKKITIECVLPKVKKWQYGQISEQAFNAIATDIQFQCMLIGVRHFYQAGGLPLGFARDEHFLDIPLGEKFYVSMEVVSSSNAKLVANIISHDLSGKVYSRLFGAEGTISQHLNHLFVPAKNRESTRFAFWHKTLKGQNLVTQALYEAIYRRFVNQIIFEDPEDFYALNSKPRIYLANHQVGIESILFAFGISAIANSVIHGVAKVEHQQSWMSKLLRHMYSYPQITDPNLIFYFKRDNQLSMLQLLNPIKQVISEQGHSLLVHVQGTRSLSCREMVTNISAVFIDLALELNIPIIPVSFVGGLPVEAVETRLEFPVGYTYQNYHLGKAIYPETLKKISNVERKALILEKLNKLSLVAGNTFPHLPDFDFEHSVKQWMKLAGVGEVQAVLYKALAEIPQPIDEICTLVAAIRNNYIEVFDTPEGLWLGEFAYWLSGNRLKVNIR